MADRAAADEPGPRPREEPRRPARRRRAEPGARDEPWLEDDDRPDPALHQPTADHAARGGARAGGRAPHEPPADEDVLEETPDFLQETPEHDRLWFEQKPPRDFDFDN